MVLFLATLLASVWAFCILIAVLRARNTALWMTFWDLVVLGGLIAGVASTANTANYACNAVAVNSAPLTVFFTAGGDPFTSPSAASPPSNGTVTTATTIMPQFWADPNNCNLIKGAWGLAVANIVMFFITAMLAIVVYRSFQREMQQRFRRRRSSGVSYVPAGRSPFVAEKYFMSAGYPQRPRRAKHSSRHSRSSGRTRHSSSYLYSGSL